MKTILRAVFLGVSVLLLAVSAVREKHEIHPLTSGPSTTHSGAQFIAGATVDTYMLRDGQLVDVFSLSDNVLGLKDCKT